MTNRMVATALLAQLITTTAWAQQASSPQGDTLAQGTTPNANQTAEDEAMAEDIIVTAQIRSERLQDVPIAVNVVSSDKLASAGITDMRELNGIIPGLNITHAVGSFQPSIRGISTSANIVENPVALYIDGVYMANQREGLRDLADIDQITVLKGPQGTLFGRNATAGVIQITTRRPSQTFGGEIKLGYDDYETLRGSAYVTGGLGDTVAASASISYTSQGEGWGKSLANGMELYKLYDNLSLRGKILFAPSAKTEITLIGDYLFRHDAGRSYQPYPGTTFAYPGFGPVKSRYDTYSTTPGYNRFRSRGISVEINHDLDFAKVVSISAYRRGTGGFRFDFTSVPTPFVVSTAELNNESFTQELQLVSPSVGAFQWVAGVYYFRNEIAYPDFPRAFAQPSPPFPPVRVLNSPSSEETESIAPFAQADLEITPGTTLTLGGRFTYEKRTIEGFTRTNLANGNVVTAPAFSPSSITIEEPTWRIALNQELARDVSVYASYNRGIKSGGFNIATPQAPPYLPETLDAYEIGVKSQLFDRDLTFNASAFLYKYTNLQVLTFIGGSITPIVANGAEAEIYGLDADFQAELTSQLSLSGGFQIMDSKFTDYTAAPISSPRPGGGAIIVRGDATGNRLSLAQEFVGTLALDYRREFDNVHAHLNLTGTYNSDYFFEPDNFLRQPEYVMLNSSLRLSDADDRYSLMFAVTNIFDESIIANIGTQPYAYFANYGSAPRVYSVTAGLKF